MDVVLPIRVDGDRRVKVSVVLVTKSVGAGVGIGSGSLKQRYYKQEN